MQRPIGDVPSTEKAVRVSSPSVACCALANAVEGCVDHGLHLLLR